MFSLRPLLLLALSLPLVWTQAVLNRRGPTSPTSDPFYTPPSGYESTAPGTILRTRGITASFFGLLPDLVEARQLLYRTTAINGTAIVSATTVLKPFVGAKKDRFVSFQTAYDGAAPICSPSYGYQEGSSQEDVISSLEFLIIQGYLLEGYIVSSSDYEISTEAAFAAGRLEGMAVLDSMRAVSAYSALDLTTSTPDIVGIGYSGGSIATGWAASLHSSYAPELPIKGWVAGGTPANLTGVLNFIEDTLFSGFLPAAVDGLSKPSAYGALLNPVIDSVVTPDGAQHLAFANANCAAAAIVDFAYGSITSTSFQSLGDQLLYSPEIASVLINCTMGVFPSETPTVPVFLYHALGDEIIPYANASTLADSWCANGASVNFTTFAAGGHISTEILGFVDAVQFTNKAFAGTLDINGCARQSVLTSSLDVLALGANLEPLLIELVNVLHEIGTADQGFIANTSAQVQSNSRRIV